MEETATVRAAGCHPRPRSRWWLIARDGPGGRLETLTVGRGVELALAVFGFREEAELFLHLGGLGRGDGWRTRESGPGELVSVLYGPCRGVKSVALDPLPGTFGDGTDVLVGEVRERFLGRLLGRGR